MGQFEMTGFISFCGRIPFDTRLLGGKISEFLFSEIWADLYHTYCNTSTADYFYANFQGENVSRG
jgi:hypothetical protein